MDVAAAASSVVEDEPIHEIYACLVENSFYRQFPYSVCRRAEDRAIASARETTAAVIRSHAHFPNAYGGSSSISRRGNHQHDKATVIPLDNHNNCSKEPASQFIQFYRKSCQSQRCRGIVGATRREQRPCITASIDASPSISSSSSFTSNIKSKNDIKICNTLSEPMAATKQYVKSTTKSERRRIAKRERERQVQTDKRIRFMLHSDFSEHDCELLYNGLTR